jgi:hypothetical protein
MKLIAVALDFFGGLHTEFESCRFENVEDLFADEIFKWVAFHGLALFSTALDCLTKATVSDQGTLFVLHDHPGSTVTTNQ